MILRSPRTFLVGAIALAALPAGCINVKAPENIDLGWDGGSAYGSPEYAGASDSELAKENARLRKSLRDSKAKQDKAEDRVEDLDEKVDDLQKELKETRRQRDRYKKAMEGDD